MAPISTTQSPRPGETAPSLKVSGTVNLTPGPSSPVVFTPPKPILETWHRSSPPSHPATKNVDESGMVAGSPRTVTPGLDHEGGVQGCPELTGTEGLAHWTDKQPEPMSTPDFPEKFTF